MSAGGYDKSEPNGLIVNLSIILTAIVLAAIFISGIYIYKTFISLEKEAYVNSATRSWATEYRANQKADLEAYKWVDKKAGIVQIPINKAIDKLAK